MQDQDEESRLFNKKTMAANTATISRGWTDRNGAQRSRTESRDRKPSNRTSTSFNRETSVKDDNNKLDNDAGEVSYRNYSDDLGRNKSPASRFRGTEVTVKDSGIKKRPTQRKEPGTVRIRKERKVTEEVNFAGNVPKPLIRNSIMKKSFSIDDLRSPPSTPEEYLTGDSVVMDDYFLTRKPTRYRGVDIRGR